MVFMMSSALRLTIDEFDDMVCRGAFAGLHRKIELIRGELREMNPAGPVHDELIAYLTNWSVRSTSPDEIVVRVQTGLDLPEVESRPEPDLTWVRAARYFDQHPTAADVRLAIEVSDSSLQSDLTEKARLYAEAGIADYWIVEANTRRIHVFRLPRNGEYTDRSIATETVSPLALPGIALDIDDLFGPNATG